MRNGLQLNLRWAEADVKKWKITLANRQQRFRSIEEIQDARTRLERAERILRNAQEALK